MPRNPTTTLRRLLFTPPGEHCRCLNSLWEAQWRHSKATGSDVAVCTPDKLTPRRGGVSFGFGCWTDRKTDRRAELHLPGRSRQSPRTPSSSSSTGTQSTRSGTWPPRGWGRKSSCDKGAGPGSWPRATDAQSLCIREAADKRQTVSQSVKQTAGDITRDSGCSVAAWIHFVRHCDAT